MARYPILALAAAVAVAAAGAIAQPVAAIDDMPLAGRGPAIRSAASMSLMPEATELLRRRVLVQCGLVDARDSLPWYFHFEFGRALLEAGDARGAVVQLTHAVDLNPVPRADKRLYGMWFTDYLPYFQLAEAHAKLDNWPCAAHAMQLSQSTGEAALGRVAPDRVRALQESIERNADAVGACERKDVFDAHFAKAG